MLQITPRAAQTPIEGWLEDFANRGAGQFATVLGAVGQAFGRPSASVTPSAQILTGRTDAEVEALLGAQQSRFDAQLQTLQQQMRQQQAKPDNTILGLPLPVVLIGAAGLIYYVRNRA